MRDRSTGSGRGDDWVPPVWSHPVETVPAEPAKPSGAFYQPQSARRINIGGSGEILGLAIAPGIIGFFALVFGLLPFLSSSAGTTPRGMLALLFLQIGSLLVARMLQTPSLVLSWTACLFVTGLLAPLLALQVTLLREPYVSLARHSATPSLFATFVVVIAMSVGAVWCVVVGWRDPDQAALLFMPAGLLWPAMIGVGSEVSQRSALLTIGEVCLLTSLAMAAAVVMPPFYRIFVPAATLAFEFGLLWIAGHGPWFQPTSGGIVELIYGASLVIAALLIVAAPLLAMAAGTFLSRRGGSLMVGERAPRAVVSDPKRASPASSPKRTPVPEREERWRRTSHPPDL